MLYSVYQLIALVLNLVIKKVPSRSLCFVFSMQDPVLLTPAAAAISNEAVYEELPESAPFRTHLMAGALAGIAEHTITYPFDLIKTRMQVNWRIPSPFQSLNNNEMSVSAFNKVTPFPGWKAAWSGVSSVILGAGPAHALYFASYEAVKKTLTNLVHKDQFPSVHTPPWVHSVAGVVATTLADALMCPFDVIKQRMQIATVSKNSMFTHAKSIFMGEGGLRAFYIAYPTTLLMNVPFHAVQFPVYEGCCKALNPHSHYSPGTHIVSGAVAGGLAAALTTPIDVIKTTLQTRNAVLSPEDCSRIRGAWSTIQWVLVKQKSNENGVGGGYVGRVRRLARFFWRGTVPRVLTFMPSTAICWTTYEYFKWLLQATSAHE